MIRQDIQLENSRELNDIEQQNNRLLILEKDILQAVALGKEPQNILDSLCIAAELIVPDSLATIMLFDNTRQSLHVRSAPNAPDIAIQQLNGLEPGPQAGSCGTAVYYATPVYVENTRDDARWCDFQQFAVDFNISACWSHPIMAKDGLPIGSFALSHFARQLPDSFQERLLNVVTNIAGIVLQREIQEQKLWDLAHRDIITGIPNRTHLNQQLQHAIKNASRQHAKLGLFFIDLDNFKKINDNFGHKTGDRVLIETAARIQSCIRQGDTLARYGGDEFVLLTENISADYNVGLIAEKIIHGLSAPMIFDDIKLVVTPSIGISVFPDDGNNAETLLVNADTAMYQAKTNGRNNFICYKPELTQVIQNRLKLENELKSALQNNEFTLHYQPQYTASDSSHFSVEALVRWNHPEQGLLLPGLFVTAAEQSGLIKALGETVIRQACVQGKAWLDAGLNLGKIAVNISALQICHGCYAFIHNVLIETGLPARHLEIEITESLMVQQSAEVLAELHLIQDAGITIALDDFGTGYSSLSQLQTLPINKLKIDRSFVTNIPGNHNDEVIVKTIIAMGRNLGLSIIAEGVETKEQASFLLNEGCDAFQGYLFSRPISASELEQKIQTNSFLSYL